MALLAFQHLNDLSMKYIKVVVQRSSGLVFLKSLKKNNSTLLYMSAVIIQESMLLKVSDDDPAPTYNEYNIQGGCRDRRKHIRTSYTDRASMSLESSLVR